MNQNWEKPYIVYCATTRTLFFEEAECLDSLLPHFSAFFVHPKNPKMTYMLFGRCAPQGEEVSHAIMILLVSFSLVFKYLLLLKPSMWFIPL
jgi:hypothetical protein